MEKALIYFCLWFYHKTEGHEEDAKMAAQAFEIECDSDLEIAEAMGLGVNKEV